MGTKKERFHSKKLTSQSKKSGICSNFLIVRIILAFFTPFSSCNTPLLVVIFLIVSADRIRVWADAISLSVDSLIVFTKTLIKAIFIKGRKKEQIRTLRILSHSSTNKVRSIFTKKNHSSPLFRRTNQQSSN